MIHTDAMGVRRPGFGAFCRNCKVWFIARVSQRGWDYYCSRNCSQRVNGRKFDGFPLKGSGAYVTRAGGREHRVLAEQWLGRRLDRSEHVHHLNGDKSDNRPENLVLVNQPDHMRLHNGQRVSVLDMFGQPREVQGREVLNG